jgi:hypothetical protein
MYMKRTALVIAAALMASPVFADDLCTIQLQKIDNALKTTPAMSTATATDSNVQVQRIKDLQKEAVQHQQAGDTKKCIASANQALSLVRKPGGDTGGSK